MPIATDLPSHKGQILKSSSNLKLYMAVNTGGSHWGSPVDTSYMYIYIILIEKKKKVQIQLLPVMNLSLPNVPSKKA